MMACTIMAEFEALSHSSLTVVFGEGLNADAAVTKSLKAEALRFQHWYYWPYLCGFQEKIIICAGMGLTFWRIEEECTMEWLWRDGQYCISNKAFKERVREIIICRKNGSLTDLPPSRTAVEGSSRVAPAEKATIPTTSIITKEPAQKHHTPTTETTIVPSVPDTTEPTSL